MSLIFTNTEDLFNISNLIMEFFKFPIIVDDENMILVKILSYKNGFSGLFKLSGDYVDVKIIFDVFSMIDKTS